MYNWWVVFQKQAFSQSATITKCFHNRQVVIQIKWNGKYIKLLKNMKMLVICNPRKILYTSMLKFAESTHLKKL